MILSKNDKANILKALEKLEDAFKDYSKYVLKYKNDYNLRLEDVLNMREPFAMSLKGTEYAVNINNHIDDMSSFLSRRYVATNDLTKLLLTANRYASDLEQLIFFAERHYHSFNKKESRIQVNASIDKLINNFKTFNINSQDLTKSGLTFLELYCSKILMQLNYDKIHFTQVNVIDSSYSKYYSEYVQNYQEVFDETQANIFDRNFYGDTQKFLNHRVKPSDMLAIREYLEKEFHSRTIYEEPEIGTFIKESLGNETELTTLICEKWRATNPEKFSDFNYEYASPFSNNIHLIGRCDYDQANSQDIEAEFINSLEKFERIKSWAILWYYAKNKQLAKAQEVILNELVYLVDQAPNKKRDYENYARYVEVVTYNLSY